MSKVGGKVFVFAILPQQFEGNQFQSLDKQEIANLCIDAVG